MLYEDHARLSAKTAEAWRTAEELRDRRTEMFNRTQVSTSGEPVVHSATNDRFDNYLMEKERTQIDEKIEEAEKIWQEWNGMTKSIEADLRKSKALFDRIYVKKVLDHEGARRIAREMNYSERQARRLIRKMSENVRISMI